METLHYEYKNAPIPGGGYVTGFLYSKTHPGVLYCRTDIGGVYRYIPEEERWKSLIDHVSMQRLDETYPAAIAVRENVKGSLYIACGVDGRDEGVLAVSKDFGETFSYHRIPTAVHGNLNGRGTGCRLVISEDGTITYASQKGGLLISRDEGDTWEVKDICGETYLTFVFVSPDTPELLVVGTAGVTTGSAGEEPDGSRTGMRGTTLYVSYDGGRSFAPMPQPKNRRIPGSKWSGYVAQRYDYDGSYLYVTLANTGAHSYVTELGYSCDSGDTLGGRVLRYSLDSEGRFSGYEDITPEKKEEELPLAYGFGGISSCQAMPGLLVCTTICKEDGDCVYRSFDYGRTWETILYDLSIGTLQFRTSYMKPEYNGGHSLLHWLSDIKINPFDEREAWFNSGTGVFRTKNLTEEHPVFSDWCDGIEETVHLNVYSPSDGPVQVIDIVGDLGGFAFRDLTKPCRNSFDDAEGNRYITCINADVSDTMPECFVATPRGNWTGKTKGGLIVTKDAGETFKRLPLPFGITDKLDELLHGIEHPNVNSGWAAMSPDGTRLVWSVAEWISLPASCVIYSADGGQSFAKCRIFDANGCEIGTEGKGLEGSRGTLGAVHGMKVFSDRVDNSLFYGFGEASQLYVSTDGGVTFYEKKPVTETAGETLPKVDFSLIDCANKTEIRGDAGRSGSFYLALGNHGLWKLRYDKRTDTVSVKRLTKDGETVYRVGLGVRASGGAYLGEDKAIYISGIIEGKYGFYRSLDEAETWVRLNTEKQMFGEINSLDGDSRTFGRFFLATGSRGLIYGESAEDNTEK